MHSPRVKIYGFYYLEKLVLIEFCGLLGWWWVPMLRVDLVFSPSKVKMGSGHVTWVGCSEERGEAMKNEELAIQILFIYSLTKQVFFIFIN
jgi:hypothetical protein